MADYQVAQRGPPPFANGLNWPSGARRTAAGRGMRPSDCGVF
jgi:hypothetical protein